jgi:copper chaperone CopZ
MKSKVINTLLIFLAGALLATLALFVRFGASADTVAILKSSGITCASCAGRIEKGLSGKAGVASVAVDVTTGIVTVAYDSKLAKPEALARTITSLGYGSSIAQVLSPEQYREKTGKAVAVLAPAKTDGCGCCNRNRN